MRRLQNLFRRKDAKTRTRSTEPRSLHFEPLESRKLLSVNVYLDWGSHDGNGTFLEQINSTVPAGTANQAAYYNAQLRGIQTRVWQYLTNVAFANFPATATSGVRIINAAYPEKKGATH